MFPLRCKINEPVGGELRRSRTASRLLTTEFTVEETKTYDASEVVAAAAASEFTNGISEAAEVEEETTRKAKLQVISR